MAADSVWARTVSTSDYYPFGLEMQGRTWHDTTTYTIVRDTVQRISYEALTQCNFEDGDACGWTVEAGGTLTTAETADGGVMQFTVAACGEDCPESISATKALTTESGQEYRITMALDLGDAERVIVSVRGEGDDGDEELASVEYTQDNLPENGEASLFFTANGAASTLYVTHGAPEAVVDADVVIFDDVEVEQVVFTEAVELRAVDGYRYGFNGKEKELELGDNFYTAAFWEYDAILGRRWNIDPVQITGESPYATMGNNPIALNDPTGECAKCPKPEGKGKEGESRLTSASVPHSRRKSYERWYYHEGSEENEAGWYNRGDYKNVIKNNIEFHYTEGGEILPYVNLETVNEAAHSIVSEALTESWTQENSKYEILPNGVTNSHTPGLEPVYIEFDVALFVYSLGTSTTVRSLFSRVGARGEAATWNEFQSMTAGQFASRAEAAAAWASYKQANGIVIGVVRSGAQKSMFLRNAASSGMYPRWMNQWLRQGKVPPGYHVDHIRPLSIGGEDVPANMRLLDIDFHINIHHRIYHPWR